MEKTLFEIQPASCRQPLPRKAIVWDEWHLKSPERIKAIERVLYFDPTPVYERTAHLIDPYKRHVGISMEQAFPKPEGGLCSCGCGEQTKEFVNGKFMKWASPGCQNLASNVLSIINNYFKKPSFFIKIYSGALCDECKDPDDTWNLQLDHIVGVKQGGGGCWLSNYRWMCHDCHVAKTNATFGRKSSVSSKKGQIKAEL